MGGSNTTLSIVLKLIDEASGAMAGVARNFKNAGGLITEDATAASQKFAVGMGAAVTAIGGLGYAALKAAGDMEQTKVAFTTMLGSAAQADTFIKQLVQFAKTTPFTLTGLEDSAKQLLAYGIEQKDVLPNLKALGDIAAGVGMDKLPNLILAFGQVKAATHLTGMELRQFTEAGVPLLDMLAQQFHVNVSEIQDMVSKGQIGFPAVEQALKSLSGEGGRFNNLMDKQSHTLEGMMSNLQDAWNIFLTGEGQKLLEWAKKFVDIAIYIVQNVLPVWIDRIQGLIDFFEQHKIAIYIVAGAIMGALVPAIWAAVTAMGALLIELLPFMIAGAVIAGVVAGIVWVVQHWDMLKTKITEFMEHHKLLVTLLSVLFPAGIVIVGIVKGIEWMIEHWNSVMSVIQTVIGWFEKLIDIYNQVIAIASKPINFVVNGLGGGGGSGLGSSFAGGILSAGIHTLIPFASGGIVTGPTPALVGESGPEAIIPLSRAGGLGTTINVTITGNTISNGLDMRRIADAVSDEIVRTLRLNQKLAI